MKIHREFISSTALSGAISTTTNRFIDGILRQVLVSPATQTTSWDITLTDSKGFLIYKRTNKVGDLAEVVEIPIIEGAMTLAIANASVDEAFEIALMVEQNV